MDVGVLRPERRGVWEVWLTGEAGADSRVGSVVGMRAGDGAAPEVRSETSARMGTGGGMFSCGFGTRRASRMNRKSRPNSCKS
jgi:hypothetical protein